MLKRKVLFFMSEKITDSNQEKQDKPKKKVLFEGLFVKLKKIKHLDKILTVLFIAIILLIYFSSFSFGTSSNNKSNIGQALEENQTTSLTSYQNVLERKIEETVSAIKNAGNVNAMVNFSQGIETVIAYSTETKHNKDGSSTEIKSPVLITKDGKSEPIILQENMPKPTSIIIVATGAKDTNVKLEILRAIQAMFELNSSNIEIFAGN